ncbi:uncharacterized protein EAF01_011289 [Botrytis porri]|uniref:Uncharacterized protein n=1 Tax=Botrytis porri TaxID=87229 RepID=A0A4Z1KKQ9_9HELO|nr:uncharacterized protein EAF01_011289 [Botrytis porri]KAF7886611.1 hypothetical protein EAF01_011289 [Botrytis porri]TGO86653.1 hypothetical protein BPOR_0286g00030 [Botrytis porri]
MSSLSKMASKMTLRDLFNTSKSTSSSKKTPRAQRPSRFNEHLEDKNRNAEDRLYFTEIMERDELVEGAFEQYKKKYPRQWNKLRWEASHKEHNEIYDGPSEGDAESVHIEWSEDAIKEPTENKFGGPKRPISPVKKVSQDKVAKGIEVAKKALCFGSLTPEK